MQDKKIIELEAVPLEWILESGNQQRVQKILSDNMDRLCDTSSKHEPEKMLVQSPCPESLSRPKE
jgi:hypothetical protein